MYQHRYRRGIEYNQTLVGDNGDLLAWSTQIDFVRQSDPPGGWYGEVSSSDILTVIAVAGVTDFVLWVVVMSPRFPGLFKESRSGVVIAVLAGGPYWQLSGSVLAHSRGFGGL